MAVSVKIGGEKSGFSRVPSFAAVCAVLLLVLLLRCRSVTDFVRIQ